MRILGLAKRLLMPIYAYLVPPEGAPFGPIDDELIKNRAILTGRVLNAGAGWRDISHLVSGELVNQDIPRPGYERPTKIHVLSPIHRIPFESGYFDTVVCIAVLEHVENPDEVVQEFYRVLKPAGHLILSVPFLQPEHKSPTDFQRYTKDGLVHLAEKHGFRVSSIEAFLTVYHTLYWQVWVWLHLKTTWAYLLLRIILLRPLLWAANHSQTRSERLASFFQLVATKESL